MFIASNADPEVHKSVVETEVVQLITIGVNSHEAAEEQAKRLVEDGVTVIQLCGGFGNAGVDRISKAVKGMATIGIVKFGVYPGLELQKGDERLSLRRRLLSVVL